MSLLLLYVLQSFLGTRNNSFRNHGNNYRRERYCKKKIAIGRVKNNSTNHQFKICI